MERDDTVCLLILWHQQSRPCSIICTGERLQKYLSQIRASWTWTASWMYFSSMVIHIFLISTVGRHFADVPQVNFRNEKLLFDFPNSTINSVSRGFLLSSCTTTSPHYPSSDSIKFTHPPTQTDTVGSISTATTF